MKRVAPAESILPTSIITINTFFIYAPKTPYESTPVPSSEAVFVIERENWSDIAEIDEFLGLIENDWKAL